MAQELRRSRIRQLFQDDSNPQQLKLLYENEQQKKGLWLNHFAVL